MANWFPMALKDGARSWLLNLQHGSISSWDEMRDRFVTNFQGTRDRPPAAGDLRRIKQQPFLQRAASAAPTLLRLQNQVTSSKFV